MVRECVQLSLVPTDGESLKAAMHARGINMRYLGQVASLAASREDLEHLKVREGAGPELGREYRLVVQPPPFGVAGIMVCVCVCAEVECE